MTTSFMVIGVCSWIVCSWLIGASAGRYFQSRTAAWVYLAVSLVLSPIIGGICLFVNHCFDYIESRGQ